jgi:uncharacterized protein (DUF111 family)
MTEEALGEIAEDLVGQEVVVDCRSQYLYLGTLEKVGRNSLVLKDADVHNTRQSQTTEEVYIIQATQHGVRVNRERVYVLARDIVSLSRLDDVVEY